jgi:NADH-ubiquinone oxidoreductase chain 5
MYLLIVLAPLFSCLLLGFFGRFLSPRGSAFIALSYIFLSLLLSVICFFEVGLSHCPTYIKIYPWIDLEMFDAAWGFIFDSLVCSMCAMVTFISFLVHLYSTSYMSHDPHQTRFIAYLSLFTFSMLMLITADNFIQLFFGWEAVGLCSYLLINFWFTRLQANTAAIKAMLVNRVGDLGLALGIFLIFLVFKSVDYSIVFSLVPYYSSKTITFLTFEFNLLTLINLLLVIGVMGKSAQLGLHVWLPDAMEGPTPVSALIHAATMVTAGIFLLVRCSFLYERSSFALFFVTILGCLTAFFASVTGVFQNDLKKVIAYSTCSQLGYMVFSCGLSNYTISMFHLINHAYFKALLFLSAGAIIHALADEQDMRKMGGLVQTLPFNYVVFLIGSLALIGFPFLTGFYSKDAIIETAFSNFSFSGLFAFWLGIISAGFTSFYSSRLLYFTFISKPNGFKSSIEQIHEAPFGLAFPLCLLSFFSLFIGYLTKDLFIGIGTPYWSNSILLLPEHSMLIESEFVSLFVKWLPFFVSIGSSILAFLIYSLYSSILSSIYKTNFGYIMYVFFNRKFFFDKLYNNIIAKFFLSIGYSITYKTLDKGFIEFFGPSGFSSFLLHLSRRLRNLQSGFLNHYAYVFFIALIAFISLNLFYIFVFTYLDLYVYFLVIFLILFKK